MAAKARAGRPGHRGSGRRGEWVRGEWAPPPHAKDGGADAAAEILVPAEARSAARSLGESSVWSWHPALGARCRDTLPSMTARRPPIPRSLSDVVLYKSAHACCVCRRGPAGVQVHHIDGDPTNNIEDNLAALCPNCHDEAHATRKLTRTLDAHAVRDAKAKWEADVQAQSLRRISVAEAGLLGMRLWTYFNFTMLLAIAKNRGFDLAHLSPFPDAQHDGLLDATGFPATGTNKREPRTIFETHAQSDARRIREVFSGLTEWLIRAAPPIELSRSWTRSQLRNLAEENAIVFVNRGLYFTTSRADGEGDERVVRYTKKGIRLQFQIDTWNTYSTSALTLHFRGHNRVASLLVLRSAEVNSINGKSLLLVNATPLALGTGFPPEDSNTPAVAFRDEEPLEEGPP